MIHLSVFFLPSKFVTTDMAGSRLISVDLETYSVPLSEKATPGVETSPLPKKTPQKALSAENKPFPDAVPIETGSFKAFEEPGNMDPQPEVVAPGAENKSLGGLAVPLVTDADTVRRVGPVYPLASRRKGEEGEVRLLVGVGKNGRAASVEVVQTSGYPALDDSAVYAVRRWLFAPGSPEKVIVPVIFILE